MVRCLKQYSPERIAAELLNQLLGYEYLVWQDGAITYQAAAPKYIMRKVGISNHLITSTRMHVFADENRLQTIERDVSREMDKLLLLIPIELRIPENIFTTINAHTAGSRAARRPIRSLLSETGIVAFTDTESRTTSRFTCTLAHLHTFDLKMSTEFPEQAMAKYGCGIFVDEYDVLTCADNEVVWDLSPEIFRAHDKIITLSENVTLCAGTQPLGLQLHNTREVYTGEYTKYRDKLNLPVRVGQRDWFVLDAPKISLDSNVRSDKLCARCKGVLFDECYVLVKQAQVPAAPASTHSIALHPICLHVSPKEAAVEDEFTHVFRVQFPMRAADYATHADPVISDLYAQALKGIKRNEYIWKGVEIVYYTIGDKYVHFMHSKDYQFRACMLPQIVGRVPVDNVTILTA